ncbi:tellurite resistance TerB family protein [Thalassovita mediterranea]|jgi:tellurite resistance protein|uniref:Tellurite resistance protein n=1 Tax=Thalassovita mediterranea TaxID=340021 RepID=A0A0P1GLZ0_9RHOB|nr:tellurite resistance TerB family protein [Thalassovita mediterranea]CUH83357.1 Tellurite resistance protein [Thalassovita mediterranea]SIS34055.1 Tellurite resistance protein TerB [Thalassovita mediterranea]
MTFFTRLLGQNDTAQAVNASTAVASLDLADLPAHARATLAPAVLTMAADGRIAEAEQAMLQNLCAFSPIYARLPEGSVEALIDSLLEELKTKGAEAVIDHAAAELEMPLRETAVCFAMRVAMVDGHLAHREKQALAEIAERFVLPDDTFAQIVDVVGMLQRAQDAS